MVAPAYFASMNQKPQNPTALVTGASGGIGYEMARLFARDGYQLVLVSRNGKRLKEVAAELQSLGSPAVRVIAKDMEELEAPDEIFAETERAGITVDVLVNNAAFGARGRFSDIELDTELAMLQLNIVALTHLTRLYLDGMLLRRRGRIVNVASTAAFVPGPFMSVYYASKAYVLSFSEALYEELQGSGVNVTCICPGPTETGFSARAGMAKAKLFRAAAVMEAKQVAEIGYKGMLQNKPVVITGGRNRLVALSARLAPRRMLRKAVRGLQEPT